MKNLLLIALGLGVLYLLWKSKQAPGGPMINTSNDSRATISTGSSLI